MYWFGDIMQNRGFRGEGGFSIVSDHGGSAEVFVHLWQNYNFGLTIKATENSSDTHFINRSL